LSRNIVLNKLALGVGIALSVCAPLDDAFANKTDSLHAFTGPDGAGSEARLVADEAGNIYGTTRSGGDFSACDGDGCGTVFKLAPDGTLTVLHAFGGKGDGVNPVGGLLIDTSGNLFGTTAVGGLANQGTVFKLAPDGTETVIYAFLGGSDGSQPTATLIADRAGNLYGTTNAGGHSDVAANKGTVFRLAPDGTETILHVFAGGTDGAYPYGGLMADRAGHLFGTTTQGGGSACGGSGCGTVFKLAPDGRETILHTFVGGSDGAGPDGAMIADKAHNLYGVAGRGGASGCNGSGCGIVFKLAADGTETVLHVFDNSSDGVWPSGTLVAGKSGDLYGITSAGGNAKCHGGTGCGTVFKLAADGHEEVLHAFAGGSHGDLPVAGLALVKSGYLYGTTFRGGDMNCSPGWGCGTIFKVKK